VFWYLLFFWFQYTVVFFTFFGVFSGDFEFLLAVQYRICYCLSTGAELGGCQGGALPPQNFAWPPQWPPQNFRVTSCHCIGVLHRPLTAPLVAKLVPPAVPPNENVCLRPCLSTIFWVLTSGIPSANFPLAQTSSYVTAPGQRKVVLQIRAMCSASSSILQ